jgi:hypothetical protein
MTTRTRVSGFTTSRTVDDLSKVSEEMETSTMGSQHKVVTPIEVHEMMQNVFSDSGKGKNGLTFLDSDSFHDANQIVFEPTAIERIGGDNRENMKDRDSQISEVGNWYHYGKNSTEFRCEIPLNIYRIGKDGNKQLEIFAGGLGNYVLNIQGSTAQKSAYKISVSALFLQCLNGMTSSQNLFIESHKHTKGLDIYQMLSNGLRKASLNYKNLNSDVENLQNANVTPQQLAMFMHSGIMNGILSGSNVKEITGYFQDIENPWFHNSDLNGLRLYNSVTLFGENQKSIDVRKKLAGEIYYPLADAGIVPLPKICSFPTSFKKLNEQPVSDSGIIPDPRQMELIDIPFQENIETELVS